MSASRAHPPPLQNWLPMAIDHDNNDSFSQSLIRQFDKRQSRLHAEMEQLGYRHSICFQPYSVNSSGLDDDDGSISERGNEDPHDELPSTTAASTPLGRAVMMAPPPHYTAIQRTGSEPRRQHCARNLLRRSSAYLRAKFKAAVRDEEDEKRNSHHDRDAPVRKGQVQQDRLYATIQPPPPPPVITQYPPKPLKYSPVEPIEDEILGNNPARKWFPLKVTRS